jgi:hypothetical protein
MGTDCFRNSGSMPDRDESRRKFRNGEALSCQRVSGRAEEITARHHTGFRANAAEFCKIRPCQVGLVSIEIDAPIRCLWLSSFRASCTIRLLITVHAPGESVVSRNSRSSAMPGVFRA